MRPEDQPDQITDHAPETPHFEHPGSFSPQFQMGVFLFIGALIIGILAFINFVL